MFVQLQGCCQDTFLDTFGQSICAMYRILNASFRQRYKKKRKKKKGKQAKKWEWQELERDSGGVGGNRDSGGGIGQWGEQGQWGNRDSGGK